MYITNQPLGFIFIEYQNPYVLLIEPFIEEYKSSNCVKIRNKNMYFIKCLRLLVTFSAYVIKGHHHKEKSHPMCDMLNIFQ